MLVLEVIGHGDERSSYATAGMTRPGRPGPPPIALGPLIG